MLSNKPYLIRAFYQWIIDSACTPYIVVNANFPRCHVPLEHVENGEITLNISPMAVRDLNIANNLVEFKASFSGQVYSISAPMGAILAIYANENQQGMFFDYEDSVDDEGEAGQSTQPDRQIFSAKEENKSGVEVKRKSSHLKLVE
ncbi:MAG: sspB [Gammaproteobacteria bacterium]|jgi:stringent starvation protein B|nr:sspB [Gammaproteobacteria bacterium]